jgi:DNA-binding NarL/FixJ family response regulator
VADHCGDVVLVDDDPAFRRVLTTVLERAGYATIGVASAEEAQSAIAEQKPDLVLTDVQLPGVSGYELCRQLKDEYGDDFPVIIVSGNRTEPFDRAAGILLGADDYMVKPVDPGELIARVWRLAGRSSEKQASQSNGASSKLDALSTREHEVLDLLAAGSNQGEIAQQLFISPKTVATHIQRVLTKLGVRSRTQAVALALRQDRDVTGHHHVVEVAE